MKHSKLFTVIVCILMFICTLSACKKEPPPPPTYSVTFDANGGSILSGDGVQTVTEGADAIPPTVERKGYEFNGWEGSYTSVASDSSVRAKWIPIHTVIFDADGGTVSDTALLKQTVREGESATVPDVVRDGYEFLGWDNSATDVTSDVTIKAKWVRLFTVSYILSGGETTSTTQDKYIKQTIRDGEQATAPQVKRNGYIFKEWKKDINAAGDKITYTAVWERKVYSASEINKLISPATVEISTFRRNNIPLSVGSGFFIDSYGTIVTNYHVVAGAYKIVVKTAQGKEYIATNILGYSKDKDVAYIKVNAMGNETSFIKLSSAKPAVGEAVYALGSSLGLTGTFSSGIVSYVDRVIDNVKFIQTTAPISSGNSGGPLVNQYGEVVGMNTATYTNGQNLNLSITADEISSVSKNKAITVETFFQATCIIKYFPGECVLPFNEVGTSINSHECVSGYTYDTNFSTTSDVDMYLTKVNSDSDLLLIVITADTYEEIYDFSVGIIYSNTSKIYQSSAQFLDWDEQIINETVVQNSDGTYSWLVAMYPPKDKYKSGYKYYGLAVGYADKPMDYSYYSCSLSSEELQAFVEYWG